MSINKIFTSNGDKIIILIKIKIYKEDSEIYSLY